MLSQAAIPAPLALLLAFWLMELLLSTVNAKRMAAPPVMRWEPPGFPDIWVRLQTLMEISSGNSPKLRAIQVFCAYIFNQETHNMHQGFPAVKGLAKWILAMQK